MNQKLTYQQQTEKICELEKVIRLKEERIAYLERMLYGDRKDRKKEVQEGPGLFDGQFQQAVDEKEARLAKAARTGRVCLQHRTRPRNLGWFS